MSQLLLTPPLELHHVQRNQAFGNPYTNPACSHKRASVAVILRRSPAVAGRPVEGSNDGVEVRATPTHTEGDTVETHSERDGPPFGFDARTRVSD
jgi:hypothetical protein